MGAYPFDDYSRALLSDLQRICIYQGRTGGIRFPDRAIVGDARGGGDAVVYVRADKTIPYGEVMDLLGRLSSSGYQRISLLSQTPQNDAVEATPQPAISSARTAQ